MESSNRWQNIVEKSRNHEEQFLFFPQYFQYISKFRGLSNYIFICETWLFDFCKSNISRYGYLEVFQGILDFEIKRVECNFSSSVLVSAVTVPRRFLCYCYVVVIVVAAVVAIVIVCRCSCSLSLLVSSFLLSSYCASGRLCFMSGILPYIYIYIV